MLVPKTKQKTQPSCQQPFSQAMLAEQRIQNGKATLKKRTSLALEYMTKSLVYPLLQKTAQKNQVPLTMTVPETRWHLKQKNPRENDHDNNREVQTHVHADKDDIQNTIRQKLGKELSEALWREDTNGQPLTKLERLTKTVKPAHEESWNTQERDIQPEAKNDAALQNSQVEDQ